MLNHYLAAGKEAEKNTPNLIDFAFELVGWTAKAFLFVLLIYLVFIVVRALLEKRKPSDEESLQQREEISRKQGPKVNLSEPVHQPKPKGSTLSLDSVSTPIAKQTNQSTPSTSPTPSPNMPAPSPASPVSVGPGDFEKSLAHAGQRMDTLLAQTTELTHLLKLSEKTKTEVTVELNKAVSELKSQITIKDEQISKLESLLERKSTYPSLRALIEVKKLCLDMVGTQKPLAHDELITFVAGAVDSQLDKLDVQFFEFTEGTPLDRIPGEQVELAPRHESTEDQTKHNQVARLLRPCYYLERDSKRIVIAKALVVLYRFTPPAIPSSETSQP